jgi:hypothetical protein
MSDKPLSREQKRILAREERRVAQRAATERYRIEAEQAATRQNERFRPKAADILAAAALPLAVAALVIENTKVVLACVIASGVVACVPAYVHAEIRKFYRLAYCICVAAVCGVLLMVVQHEHEARELEKNAGVLYPGNVPRPPVSCPAPIDPSDFMVLLGDNAYLGKNFPRTLLSLRGEEIIVADQTPEGALTLRALRVFDSKNEIIARIDERGFWIHPNSRKLRPDRSTLIVYDSDDRQVLNLRFLNPTTISITGLFRSRGSAVLIDDQGILVGWGNRISRSCAFSVGGIYVN